MFLEELGDFLEAGLTDREEESREELRDELLLVWSMVASNEDLLELRLVL